MDKDDLESILAGLDSQSLPIKWHDTPGGVPQSIVENGVCNLFYGTNSNGDNAGVGDLLKACLDKGGLADKDHSPPDAKWLTWYNNLPQDLLWKISALTQGEYRGKGAVIHGTQWPRTSPDNQYSIATDSNAPVAHEIKHVYNGLFHR